MGKHFETELSAEVGAGPEQVWAAIATGPGISSWFVGRTEVDGATVRTAFGDDWIPAGEVTAGDEPHRFAYATPPAPNGRFVAYEFLIEGRAGGSTVLRAVTSGFLPGDDWAAEYEAMQYGTALFFATLREYLQHFPGRPATPVTAFGPPVDDWDAEWAWLHEQFGLSDPKPGDKAHGAGVDGEVYFVNPHTLGIRTENGFLRFLRGFHGAMVAGHALFTPAPDAGPAWTAFLTRKTA